MPSTSKGNLEPESHLQQELHCLNKFLLFYNIVLLFCFYSQHSSLQATVHILPEISLLSHPEGALWSCYHKFGCQATTTGALEKPPLVSLGKNRLGRTQHKKVILIQCIYSEL